MNTEMAQLERSLTAATPLPKWVVIRRTQTRRTRGDSGEWLQIGDTFHGDWIVLGWVKMTDKQRWVKVADCEKVTAVDPPVEPPPADGSDTLMWMKSDWQLRGTKLERKRPNIAGYPQTVNLACKTGGTLPASDDYIRIVRDLNPGMTMTDFERMMDSWNRINEKWRNGNRKVPAELVFASNTFAIRSKLRNGGGLTGIPRNAWVYEIDTLPYSTLNEYSADTLPQKYIMHLTLAKRGRENVDPSPAMGGRSLEPFLPTRLPVTSSSVMYIRVEFMELTIGFRNPYLPEWNWEK